MAGNESDDDEDWEEKFESERLLEDAEDGVSTTMSEDIEQLRNAAEVVGEMVESQNQDQTYSDPASIPAQDPEQVNIPIISNTVPLMQHFEEELPAYEDNDGSDMSSIVSDGYRPGTLYTPSQSSGGSLSDILGPDTKS